MAFAGPKNRQGEQGERGLPGIDGSQWLSGIGEPDVSIGEPDDFYIDTTNADVYRKLKKSWIWQLNIKGPKGKRGEDGRDGKDGETRIIRQGALYASDENAGQPNYISISVDENYTVTNEDFIRVIGTSPVIITLPSALNYKKILKIKNNSTQEVTVVPSSGTVNNQPNIQIRPSSNGIGQCVDFCVEGGQFWVT